MESPAATLPDPSRVKDTVAAAAEVTVKAPLTPEQADSIESPLALT